MAASQPLRVMIAGAPAAGKGTQCAKIVEKVRHGCKHCTQWRRCQRRRRHAHFCAPITVSRTT